MKKKGFTLIELLAVIIILAIVALVATPIILNVVNDAKKSAGLSEAKMIYSGINNYCEEAKLKEQLNGTESTCKDGVTIEEVSQMVNLGNAKVIKLTYVNKVTELTVESNGYTYTLKDGEIVLGEGTSEEETSINRCTYAGELVQGAEYENGAYIYHYMATTVMGTGGDDGFVYLEGTDEEVWNVHINPDYIESLEITTPICSVINDKPVTEVHYMFFGEFDKHYYDVLPGVAKATSVNLKGFDTSKITDMSNMFWGSQATALDLSSFDTSNVTNMENMFVNCKTKILDLSSFDTSKVENMYYMFGQSSATTGYARTQADADRLNSSSLKPDTLTFVVKPTS